ncbi:MAG: glycosyltransferase family 39 protein [Thermodesulfobacteriota bacterium]
MTFSFSASLLTSLIIGCLLSFIFIPHLKNGAAGLAFRLFAGAGLGIGVTSCVYFICLLAGLTRYVPAIDLVICLVLGLLCFVLSRRGFRKEPLQLSEIRTFSGFRVLLTVIFSIELIASLLSFAIAFLKEPHGRWDAWLIWNMHARFLFRSGEEWRSVFASGLDWSHWDYPLLLPLSIVRSWNYMGGESRNVPALMGLLFTCLILGLLLCSLSLLRSRAQGYLAPLILMGTPFFIALGASQFADIPFAFFILATLVMLFFQRRSPGNHAGPLILAGIAAGLCAWTKNEGLLFVPIVTVSLAGAAAYTGGWRQSFKRTGWFLAGALPVLLIVLYFKTRLSPANDLVAGFSLAAASAKLLDPGRYAEIARAFFITGISFTQGLIDVRVGMHLNPGAVNILLLVVYLLLTGIKIDEKDRVCLFQTAAVLLLMLAGYFFVYVMTPLDLNYHLMTSLNRLFLQLWPSAVFLFFMAAGLPEPASLAGGLPETASLQPQKGPGKGKKHRKTKEMK